MEAICGRLYDRMLPAHYPLPQLPLSDCGTFRLPRRPRPMNRVTAYPGRLVTATSDLNVFAAKAAISKVGARKYPAHSHNPKVSDSSMRLSVSSIFARRSTTALFCASMVCVTDSPCVSEVLDPVVFVVFFPRLNVVPSESDVPIVSVRLHELELPDELPSNP